MAQKTRRSGGKQGGKQAGGKPAASGKTELPDLPALADGQLLAEIRSMIEASRGQVARVVNTAMVITYWSIGDRIRREVVGEARAEYVKQLVNGLSERLSDEFGMGFSRTNLFNMLRFAETFPDLQTVQPLAGQLGWTHLTQLVYVENPLAREFYTRLCIMERWSRRTLRQKIQGMLFERTAISRKPGFIADLFAAHRGIYPPASHEDVIPRKAPRNCVPTQQIPCADRGIQPRLLRCRFSVENMRARTVRASTKRLSVRRVDSSVGAGGYDGDRVQRGASFGMTARLCASPQLNRRRASLLAPRGRSSRQWPDNVRP
jgi:hypothetical protein